MIDEYNNKEEDDEKKGRYLIKVARHKTAAKGPARVIVSKNINDVMNIYLQHIRSKLTPQCRAFESRLFLTPTENEYRNVSEAINKVAKCFNLETPNATIHWKIVSTETKKHKKSCIDEVCDQMSHSRATCERFYQRTSNEQSFAAQETIEELCSNKYFRSDQSDIIAIEWPLTNNTVPLALCREMTKKYITKLTNKSRIIGKYLKRNMQQVLAINTACICINYHKCIETRVNNMGGRVSNAV